MEINLTTLAAAITALGVIFGAIFAIYRWFLKQEKQDRDIKAIKEEQTVLVHGVLACLKKTRVNRGELPKYHAEDTHEAIIDIDTFVAVQNEMARRLKGFEHKSQVQKTYPFTHKMVCGCCGAYYRRKTTKTRVVWICATFNQKGKALCPQSKQLPEETLIALCNDVLSLVEFNEQIFINKVSQIRILDNNRVQFLLSNGKTEERTWKDRSRSESWTDEMKEVARQRTLQRYAPKEVE